METPCQCSLPPACFSKLQKIIPGVGAGGSSYTSSEVSSWALPPQGPTRSIYPSLLNGIYPPRQPEAAFFMIVFLPPPFGVSVPQIFWI